MVIFSIYIAADFGRLTEYARSRKSYSRRKTLHLQCVPYDHLCSFAVFINHHFSKFNNRLVLKYEACIKNSIVLRRQGRTEIIVRGGKTQGGGATEKERCPSPVPLYAYAWRTWYLPRKGMPPRNKLIFIFAYLVMFFFKTQVCEAWRI